ncbi:PepSY domain-containing protein [Psychrobacillus lasiicapitis]|uniref:PepSY domain-containing protein n=1 Tax=Psychrobacillus lasiicapitis TaxID=1636719 RepID=UPI001FD476F1|nr:PepSY domain-containing protein [Psychrobacillus lasiicapitis]
MLNYHYPAINNLPIVYANIFITKVTVVPSLTYARMIHVRRGGLFSLVNPMQMQRITIEQAMQVARRQVPGQVIHVDLDMENGLLVYEVFISTAEGRVYQVDVNAKTGVIVDIDQESSAFFNK